MGQRRQCKSKRLYSFLQKRKEKSSIGNRIFVQHRIVSAACYQQFVNDRMSFIVLRGNWCNIIVLNVHALTREESDDSKDSFYKKLEQVFKHFPEHHIKILL